LRRSSTMSDQAEPEPHAPFTGDVSHSGLDALKHGEPTCAECGHALYVVKGNVAVHHECPVGAAMRGEN
jgi:hypothetical protein